MTSLEKAQGLLSYVRFLSWDHQVSHWTVTGENFFSDHQLFARLYEDTTSFVDSLAERMVGQWGSVAVDPVANSEILLVLVRGSATLEVQNPADKALRFVRGLMDLYVEFREGLESEGLLTTGWEDLLDAHKRVLETHEYLLQQRVGHWQMKVAAEAAWFESSLSLSDYSRMASTDSSSERFFHDNPDRKSVKQLTDSKALSNLPESGLDNKLAPPTPVEARDATPGGDQISTLSRFLVQTDHPEKDDVPQDRDDLPKHPVLASWSFMRGK